MYLEPCLDIYADAAFYDAEFEHRNHELPFYLDLCRRVPGPVLEVACGTGRLTIPLAEAGFDIAGLDVAPDMIRLAQEKASHIPWHLQDARSMSLGKRFGLIFMACNALQHLTEDRDVSAFLERAAAHLDADGALVLDVFQPNPEKLSRPFATRYLHKTFEWQGAPVEVYVQSEYLKERRIFYFELSYEIHGRVQRTKRVHMRCFFPEELERLCRRAGLNVEARFGGYDSSDLTESSPKQILICRRKP